MSQVDQNINKDMIDCDLIDLESLDFSNDQTWLYKVPEDSEQNLDIIDWYLSFDWPNTDHDSYIKEETQLYATLDNIIKNDTSTASDKQKFDSRTYVRPKKRNPRPSLSTMVEKPASLSSGMPSRFMTYNKYNSPLSGVSPMLRLKTFNVDTNNDIGEALKDYAAKRKSLVHDDAEDPQLEDIDITLVSETSERLSSEHMPPSKPIRIDYSQPAHNLHNTFNKGLSTIISDRPSLNMYQSGESLMRMSPPSLVSSLMMDSSGTFNPESLEAKKTSLDRLGITTSGRESIDHMMTSMTLSILDEKDMSTSFLSQTTYNDHEGLDSMPPSLVSSVNSSYIVSQNTPKTSIDSNFNSNTFTNSDHQEKLLNRPRCQPYTFNKKDLKNSESYTKQANTNDTFKVLNENSDKIQQPSKLLTDTVTLHFANNKFRCKDSEKENLNSTFEKDDAFYKDMGMQKAVELGNKESLNVTLDKKELNEIIQARQKLSLARKALPVNSELKNEEFKKDVQTIQMPDQTIITVPRQVMENASELLSRRKIETEVRDTPKRNMTFKKVSPRCNNVDETVVYDNNQMIDINSATLNLIDSGEKNFQQNDHIEDWNPQTRAMVGSNESTDTATFSSSSPPDSVPEVKAHDLFAGTQAESTPFRMSRRDAKSVLHNITKTISPIYLTDQQMSNNDRTLSGEPTSYPPINTATLVKKPNAKRDILSGKESPDKKLSPPLVKSPVKSSSYGSQGSMAPPPAVPRKSGLPSSKLRQYSSHKELSRLPGSNPVIPKSSLPPRTSLRRQVYASNPALSPTHATSHILQPVRRDSYTVATDNTAKQDVEKSPPRLVRQGTETLTRRERPQSQIIQPKELRAPTVFTTVPTRANSIPAPSRPYSIAGTAALRGLRPTSGPVHKPAPAVSSTLDTRPVSSESRASVLPRPSRLPAPRRSIRPPSVYSVAPTADYDHY